MKFTSDPIEEHAEVPLADDGRWENLIDDWSKKDGATNTAKEQNSCYVVCVGKWRNDAIQSAQLMEILGLVGAQGDRVVGHEVYKLLKPVPKTLLGRGASEQIAERAMQAGADMLVLDAELTPSQTRNLEEVTGLPICDREAVILNVFSRHAKTKKARIQVAIAHLEYLRPRIRGIGLVMDQQAGGIMGGKGPGETQSQLLARSLDRRLIELRKSFDRLQRMGQTQRKQRDDCSRIALVGYTNAGKTTLMNALTDAGLSAKDKPFETLDTTSRSLTRHGRDVLLSDTVGFIRRLPKRLLDSFESTLSEIKEASMLVLVVDVSDPEAELHLQTTESVLGKLNAEELPRFYVFNKVDKLPEGLALERLNHLSQGYPFKCLSGHDETAVSQLKESLLLAVRSDQVKCKVFVPYGKTTAMQAVYAKSRVVECHTHKNGLLFTIEADKYVVEKIKSNLSEA